MAPGALISIPRRPARASASAALPSVVRLGVGRTLRLSASNNCVGNEVTPAKRRPGRDVDRRGDLDHVDGGETALVAAIKRVARCDDARQDWLDPPAREASGARLAGLVERENGPVFRRHRRGRVGFGARNLHEVTEVADGHPGAAAGARAFHVDGDRGGRAASGDGAAERAVAAHLLGHREGLQAVSRRRGDNEARVALDRVEVDDIGVGGDPAGLVKGDRLRDQGRVAAQDEIEKHARVLPLSAVRVAQRQGDGDENDEPARDHLVGGLVAHQDQAIVEHAHQ